MLDEIFVVREVQLHTNLSDNTSESRATTDTGHIVTIWR